MNIHIIKNEKFTKKVVDFIDSNYERGSNIVYVYGDDDFFIDNRQCVKKIKKFNEIDFSLLLENGKIFVHGFFDDHLNRFLVFNKQKYTNNVLVLVVWGGDAYSYLTQKNKLNLEYQFNELIKKLLVKRANQFMTFAYADYDIVRKRYGAKGEQFDCLYPSNVDIDFLDSLRRNFKRTTTTNIMVGNSAAISNNHIDAFKQLSKFRGEDIRIICFLNYAGSKKYIDRVCQMGRKSFGDKFCAVTEYLSPNEYAAILNDIDVAVFNHKRQQGTGNIEILSYLGKKMFIRSDTTSWNHYVERDNCIFFDTNSIARINFDEFVAFSNSSRDINVKYFKNIWNIDYIKQLWDKVM